MVRAVLFLVFSMLLSGGTMTPIATCDNITSNGLFEASTVCANADCEIFGLRWPDVMYREQLIAVRAKLKGGKMRYVPSPRNWRPSSDGTRLFLGGANLSSPAGRQARTSEGGQQFRDHPANGQDRGFPLSRSSAHVRELVHDERRRSVRAGQDSRAFEHQDDERYAKLAGTHTQRCQQRLLPGCRHNVAENRIDIKRFIYFGINGLGVGELRKEAVRAPERTAAPVNESTTNREHGSPQWPRTRWGMPLPGTRLLSRAARLHPHPASRMSAALEFHYFNNFNSTGARWMTQWLCVPGGCPER